LSKSRISQGKSGINGYWSRFSSRVSYFSVVGTGTMTSCHSQTLIGRAQPCLVSYSC
jgi:hypothetical protein